MKPLHYLLILAALIIAYLIWTRPEDQSEENEKKEQAYKIQHAIDSIKLVESGARIDSISSKLVDTVRVVIVKAEAKDKEIKVLKARLATRRPQVQPLIDSIPSLKAFIETQDSVILTQDEQIESLRGGMYQISKELNALIGEQEVNSRIAAEMLQSCERRREEMKADFEKEVKKEKRKTKLAVIGGIAATVGAFLLGAQ